ncbi:MAG: alanine racemase [Clostridia bacterium]|nr:alanine racemase [Clostridia bacterium]
MAHYNRVYAQINKNSILKNIKKIKESLKNDVKLMPVIKADAYGHGALEVAKLLVPYSDFFAVAVIEEALQIKQEGIKTPLLILGYVNPDSYEDIVDNDIRIPVFTYEAAKRLSDIAKKKNKIAKIHIAIDTGMNRIGFKNKPENLKVIEEISVLENIFIEGIFTHFATADEKDNSFMKEQEKSFSDFVVKLESMGICIPIKHVSNSAAIIYGNSLNYNMVRSGIITYGLYPSDEVDKSKLIVEPSLEFISHVVYVKIIEKGDTVSYGRTFTAEKPMKIATIPVGYADGYPRLLSNKGRVIINGKYAPIIGRICMDQFMVDVSDIEDVNEGDTVILIGKQGDCAISADEIAVFSQTINYEIVCGIGKRVPRIYI